MPWQVANVCILGSRSIKSFDGANKLGLVDCPFQTLTLYQIPWWDPLDGLAAQQEAIQRRRALDRTTRVEL